MNLEQLKANALYHQVTVSTGATEFTGLVHGFGRRPSDLEVCALIINLGNDDWREQFAKAVFDNVYIGANEYSAYQVKAIGPHIAEVDAEIGLALRIRELEKRQTSIAKEIEEQQRLLEGAKILRKNGFAISSPKAMINQAAPRLDYYINQHVIGVYTAFGNEPQNSPPLFATKLPVDDAHRAALEIAITAMVDTCNASGSDTLRQSLDTYLIATSSGEANEDVQNDSSRPGM